MTTWSVLPHEPIEELADTPDLVRVIPGHITPIVSDAAAALHRVAGELA